MQEIGIPQIQTIDWADWCLRLDDGRVWSTKLVGFADADFVADWKDRKGLSEVPLCQANQETDAHDEAGLRFQLSFFSVPVGELGSVEERFASLRRLRDELLALTDFAVLPDSALPEEALAQIKAYRTALRDLPNQEDAPFDGGYSQTPWPVLYGIATLAAGHDPLAEELAASLEPKKYHQAYDLDELMRSPVFAAKLDLKRFMGAVRAGLELE